MSALIFYKFFPSNILILVEVKKLENERNSSPSNKKKNIFYDNSIK